MTADSASCLSLPDPRWSSSDGCAFVSPDEFLPIVSLTADVLGVITPEKLFVRVSLIDSRIAGSMIGGDFGLLIRYSVRSRIRFNGRRASTRRSRLRPSCAAWRGCRWTSRHPSSHVARGGLCGDHLCDDPVRGQSRVGIDLAVASANGHLAFDALIRFLPEFGFVVDIDAGVSVHAFGFTLCAGPCSPEPVRHKPVEGDRHRQRRLRLVRRRRYRFRPDRMGRPDQAAACSHRRRLKRSLMHLSKPDAWAPMLPRRRQRHLVRLRAFPPASELPLHPLGRLESPGRTSCLSRRK